jgi:hypothetical protein
MAVLGGFLVLLAAAALVFRLRSPVILVSDAPFAALYGALRGRKKQLELSLRFFRPFRTVITGENAGADMVVFAVEEISKSPYAVLFPYRYYEGARRYGEKFPEVPALVLGGRGLSPPRAGGPVFIGTDSLTDYYRAGLAAALFLQKRPGKLLFLRHETVSAAAEGAFLAGFRGSPGGRAGEDTIFLDSGAAFEGWQDLSCVVLSGPAQDFLDRNLGIPVILFSWIDPAMTPAAAGLIFDDSPWALAARALGPEGGKGGVLASETTVVPERIGDPEMVQALRRALAGIP